MASNPPLPVTVILWLVAVAVNLYQTSLAAELRNVLQVLGARLCVALTLVPAVGEQLAPAALGVNAIAAEHSSLAGGMITLYVNTELWFSVLQEDRDRWME